MFLSTTTQYAILLLPAGVLSALAGRSHEVLINSSSLATSTKASNHESTTKPDLSTITSTSSWDGTGTIPPLNCPSAPLSGWCRVSVGTVQLNFWPTGAATKNITYPSTTYLSKYDFTMSSPWVYFIINTMIATDWCGNLVGTTLTDFITSYSITDVSTLQPFLYTTGTQRAGTPKQLKLSDLKLDCPVVDVSNQTYEQIGHSFVKGKFDPGCNPDLEWPTDLKYAAKNLWKACGRHDGGGLGIFDPPAPVSACPASDPECLYLGAATTTSASIPVETALPDNAASTTVTAAPLPTITSSAPVNTGIPETIETSSSEPNPVGSPSFTEAVSSTGMQIVPAASSNPTSSQPDSAGMPVDPGSSPESRQPVAVATLAGSLAVYDGETISGQAIGSSAAVIGGQTLSIGGSVVTLSGSQVASLGSSGIVVEAPGGGVTTIALPTATSSMPDKSGLNKLVGTGSSTMSILPTSTSIGALIMANFSSGDKSRQLGGSLVAWIGSCLAAVVFFL